MLVYGKTPFVIIAEKNVPKKDITSKELEDFYNGKNSTWPNGEPVRLVMRPLEDVDTRILGSLSTGMANAIKVARSRPGMIIAVTDPESNSTVSRTPGGLGATGLTSIIVEKLPVASLTLNGVKASPQNLESGAYPLAKEIRIVTTPNTSPAAKKLINFILSPQGRNIASRNGVLVTLGDSTHK